MVQEDFDPKLSWTSFRTFIEIYAYGDLKLE